MHIALKGVLLAAAAWPIHAQAQSVSAPSLETPVAEDQGEQAGGSRDIVVTARRRAENVQDVPLAISVVTADTIDATGTYGIPRLTQLQPTLQFYS